MIGRWFWLGAILAVPSSASEAVSVSRASNCVQIRLDDGWAQIRWVAGGGVRIEQVWSAAAPRLTQGPALDFSMADSPGELRLTSRELTVQVRKKPFLLTFLGPSGELLLSQSRPARPDAIEFGLGLRDRIYGRLEGAAAADLDLRGQAGGGREVFLTSTSGWGLAFPRPAAYRVDAGMRQRDILRVSSGAAAMEYWFFAGAGLKEIFAQAHEAMPSSIDVRVEDTGWIAPESRPAHAVAVEGDWPALLRDALALGLNRDLPALGLGRFFSAPDPVRRRVELLAAVMPLALCPEGYPLGAEARALRASLSTHLLTYFQECNDRGFPVLHPLVFQYPRDGGAAAVADEFLLGDELLVAPLIDGGESRSVYFPPGAWTDLRDNRMYRGRSTAVIEASAVELPMFARNGVIVPRDRRSGIELHYFPRLGAEYFLWEPLIQEVTQTHAGPAGDFLRLEIEERAGRSYRWVVHNIAPPAAAESGGVMLERSASEPPPDGGWRDGVWWYDSRRRELWVQVALRRGEDRIVNVSFDDPTRWAPTPRRDSLKRKEHR